MAPGHQGMVRGLETRRPRKPKELYDTGCPTQAGKDLAADDVDDDDVDGFLHRLPDIIKRNVTQTCQHSAKTPLWTRSTLKSPPRFPEVFLGARRLSKRLWLMEVPVSRVSVRRSKCMG